MEQIIPQDIQEAANAKYPYPSPETYRVYNVSINEEHHRIDAEKAIYIQGRMDERTAQGKAIIDLQKRLYEASKENAKLIGKLTERTSHTVVQRDNAAWSPEMDEEVNPHKYVAEAVVSTDVEQTAIHWLQEYVEEHTKPCAWGHNKEKLEIAKQIVEKHKAAIQSQSVQPTGSIDDKKLDSLWNEVATVAGNISNIKLYDFVLNNLKSKYNVSRK